MQIELKKDRLFEDYKSCVELNPLLKQAAKVLKERGWDDLEIVTGQLILAVNSNASLQARLQELEISLRNGK